MKDSNSFTQTLRLGHKIILGSPNPHDYEVHITLENIEPSQVKINVARIEYEDKRKCIKKHPFTGEPHEPF